MIKNRFQQMFAIFVFGFSVGVQANQLQLVEPSEFEYIHCVADKVPSRQATTHYVVDIRDAEKYKLHTARGLQNVKAKNLQRLRLVDPLLTQAQDSEFDLVWRSNPSRLLFKLNIADNGGQVLRGQVISGRKATDISCVDVVLEN